MEIVAGLRRSDARALERLVSEYGPLIAQWARVSGTEAEDVVQDVLFRVWRAGRALDPDTHLPAWLKTVTQNTIRNRWRTNVRKPSVPAGLDPVSPATSTDGGGWESIDAATDRIAIEEILRTLHPREREVLRLLYVSDLPLEEVAARLHASREATKSLAARARRRVRARIEQVLGTAAPMAATLSMMADRVAQASEIGGRGLLGAVASTAVAVFTAGALTLAGSGGAPAPATTSPARVEAGRDAAVRTVSVRTEPVARPQAPAAQPPKTLKQGVVPAATQASPPPSPAPPAEPAREVERQQRQANRTLVHVETGIRLPKLPAGHRR